MSEPRVQGRDERGGSRVAALRFLGAEARFLTFRSAPIARAERGAFLWLALGATWLAGIGRYWDHPDAGLWQHLGLGSLAYVFVLAALLWCVLRPLQPRAASYADLLLFVGLTAPLAWLYAIPVERFMPTRQAAALNVWFLATVALWRVALLLRYFAVTAGLGVMTAIVVALLPLAAIVVLLSILNLEHATFELMAGVGELGPNDDAYAIVVFLSALSVVLLPLLAIGYVTAIGVRRGALRRAAEAEAAE
ncbi:MAG: hypothetical protein R3F49_24855 [Planctomycetota bacterium]